MASRSQKIIQNAKLINGPTRLSAETTSKKELFPPDHYDESCFSPHSIAKQIRSENSASMQPSPNKEKTYFSLDDNLSTSPEVSNSGSVTQPTPSIPFSSNASLVFSSSAPVSSRVNLFSPQTAAHESISETASPLQNPSNTTVSNSSTSSIESPQPINLVFPTPLPSTGLSFHIRDDTPTPQTPMPHHFKNVIASKVSCSQNSLALQLRSSEGETGQTSVENANTSDVCNDSVRFTPPTPPNQVSFNHSLLLSSGAPISPCVSTFSSQTAMPLLRPSPISFSHTSPTSSSLTIRPRFSSHTPVTPEQINSCHTSADSSSSVTNNVRKSPFWNPHVENRSPNLQSSGFCPRFVHQNSIKSLLSQELEGMVILKYYDTNNHLSVKHQNSLARIVIKNEISTEPWKILPTERFHQLSREICAAFPSEIPSTYFLPYSHQDRKKTYAKGKLYDRYKNLRDSMINQGIITGRKKKRKNSAAMEDAHPLGQEPSIDLTWALHNDKPWAEVKDKFRTTLIERMDAFKRSGGDINSYLNTYPAYKHSEASELFETDFVATYPGAELMLLQNWPGIEAKIMSLAEEMSIASKEFSNTLTSMEIDLSNREPNAITLNAFFFLAAFFPSVIVKGKWKLSKLECKDALIMYAESEEDFKVRIAARETRLKNHGENLPPVPVFIGPHSAGSCFVYANGIFFESPTLLKSVDLCFKIYSVLKAPFPPDCLLPWTFLHTHICGSLLFKRDTIPAVNNLAQRLANLKLPETE